MEMMERQMEGLQTIGKVAEVMGVSPTTVRLLVKSPKFCKSLHARLSADERHQRLLAEDRRQFAHVEILPPTLPFLALFRTERRH